MHASPRLFSSGTAPGEDEKEALVGKASIVVARASEAPQNEHLHLEVLGRPWCPHRCSIQRCPCSAMRLNSGASETGGRPRLRRKAGGRARVGLVLDVTLDAQSGFFV